MHTVFLNKFINLYWSFVGADAVYIFMHSHFPFFILHATLVYLLTRKHYRYLFWSLNRCGISKWMVNFTSLYGIWNNPVHEINAVNINTLSVMYSDMHVIKCYRLEDKVSMLFL